MFDRLWDSLVKNEPGLSNPEYTAHIKSRNLKSVLKQFFEIGQREGKNRKPSDDLLDEIFGGRR